MSDRRDFAPVVSLRQAMDQLFNEGLVGASGRAGWAGPAAAAMPLPLDVYATADALVVIAAAPGLRPDQLHVTVNQGTLVLSGAIPDAAQSAEARDATWYVHELGSGPFRRAVALPFEVDVERAHASVEHGIAKVVLPKAGQAKPTTIPVTVAGQ